MTIVNSRERERERERERDADDVDHYHAEVASDHAYVNLNLASTRRVLTDAYVGTRVDLLKCSSMLVGARKRTVED